MQGSLNSGGGFQRFTNSWRPGLLLLLSLPLLFPAVAAEDSLFLNGSSLVLPSFAFGGTEWTWEGWVMPRTVGGANGLGETVLWDWGPKSGKIGHVSVRIGGASRKVIVTVYNSATRRGTVKTTRSIPVWSWTHVAVIHASTSGGGTEVRVLMDGLRTDLFEDAVPLPDAKTADGRLSHKLGDVAVLGAGVAFDGMLDEVRIWSVARTDGEILAAMTDGVDGGETGLEMWYGFEELENVVKGGGDIGGKATVVDLSDNERDAALNCVAFDPNDCVVQFDDEATGRIVCGDGKRSAFEECDDGNLNDGDGCASSCVVESGWVCDGGLDGVTDTCVEGEVLESLLFEDDSLLEWDVSVGTREYWETEEGEEIVGGVDGGVMEVAPSYRRRGQLGARLWQRQMLQTGEAHLPRPWNIAMWFRGDRGLTTVSSGGNKIATTWADEIHDDCALDGHPTSLDGMILDSSGPNGHPSLYHEFTIRGMRAKTSCPTIESPSTIFTFNRYRTTVSSAYSVTSADSDTRFGLVGSRVGWYDRGGRGWVEHRTAPTNSYYYASRAVSDVWYLVSGVQTDDGDELYRDSVLVAKEDGSTGNLGRLGIAGGGANSYNGPVEVAEVLVYNDTLSDMHRMMVEQYFVDRYSHHSAPSPKIAEQLISTSPSSYLTQASTLLNETYILDGTHSAAIGRAFMELWVRIEKDPKVFGIPLVVALVEDMDFGPSGPPKLSQCDGRGVLTRVWEEDGGSGRDLCGDARYVSVCFGGGGGSGIPCDETRDVGVGEWELMQIAFEDAFASKYPNTSSPSSSSSSSSLYLVLATQSGATDEVEAWVDHIEVKRFKAPAMCEEMVVETASPLSYDDVVFADHPIAYFPNASNPDLISYDTFTPRGVYPKGFGAWDVLMSDGVEGNGVDGVELNLAEDWIEVEVTGTGLDDGKKRADDQYGWAIEFWLQLAALPEGLSGKRDGIVLVSDGPGVGADEAMGGIWVGLDSVGAVTVQLQTTFGASIGRTDDYVLNPSLTPRHVVVQWDPRWGQVSVYLDAQNLTITDLTLSTPSLPNPHIFPNSGLATNTSNALRFGFHPHHTSSLFTNATCPNTSTLSNIALYSSILSPDRIFTHFDEKSKESLESKWTLSSSLQTMPDDTNAGRSVQVLGSVGDVGSGNRLELWKVDRSTREVIGNASFPIYVLPEDESTSRAIEAMENATAWLQRVEIGTTLFARLTPSRDAELRSLAWVDDFDHDNIIDTYLQYDAFREPNDNTPGQSRMWRDSYASRGYPRTFDGAKQWCEDSGLVLCPYESVCRRDSVRDNSYSVLLGSESGDQWTPYDTRNGTTNTWVYIGSTTPAHRCLTYRMVHGEEPSWGQTTGTADNTGYVQCCSRARRAAYWKQEVEMFGTEGLRTDSGLWEYRNARVEIHSDYFHSPLRSFSSSTEGVGARCSEALWGQAMWYADPAMIQWTNYTLEVEVRMTGRQLGLLTRMTDPDNYYRFQFDTDNNYQCHNFIRRVNGENALGPRIWRNSDGSLDAAVRNSRVRVRVEVYGQHLTAYYDNVKALEWDDSGNTSLSHGTFGFWGAYSRDVQFDTLRIYDVDVPAPRPAYSEEWNTAREALDTALVALGAPEVPHGFFASDTRTTIIPVSAWVWSGIAGGGEVSGNITIPEGASTSSFSTSSTKVASISSSFQCPITTVSIPENSPLSAPVSLPILTSNTPLGLKSTLLTGALDTDENARDIAGASSPTEVSALEETRMFEIERSGGRLKVLRDALDFERVSSYKATLAVTDFNRFDSGWIPMRSMERTTTSAERKASLAFREVRLPSTLAKIDPASLRVEVLVRVSDGPNRGIVFKARGAAAGWNDRTRDYSKYGGLMMAYSSKTRLNYTSSSSSSAAETLEPEGLVRLWAPTHARFGGGSLFSIGAGMGAMWDDEDSTVFLGEKNTQLSHYGEARVRITTINTPDYDSGWVYLPANRDENSQRYFEHGLPQVPARARVLVRAVTGPLAGFVMDARGHGLTTDDDGEFGGVVYALTSTEVKVWVATRYGGGTTSAFAVHVPDSYGNANHTSSVYDAEVRVQAWSGARDRAPDYSTEWGEVGEGLEFLRGSNAFQEYSIEEWTGGKLPERVDVWVRSKTGDAVIVPALEMPDSTFLTTRGMGGVTAAYNESVVRMWTVSAERTLSTFPATNNVPLYTQNGWGATNPPIYSEWVEMKIDIWMSLDPVGPVDVAEVEIQVRNVREPPQVFDATYTVAEYSPVGLSETTNGTIVGYINATDPDVEDSLVYELQGGTGVGVFEVDSDTGAILVKDPTVISFEEVESFDLLITVSDGTFSTVALARIEVLDINDPVELFPANFSIAENPFLNALVGDPLFALDPDIGQTITFSIVGGNSEDAFTINLCSGQLRVDNPSAVDYEEYEVFDLVIRAEDDGFPMTYDEAIVRVTILDVDDPPRFDLDIPAPSIAENSLAGTLAGRLPLDDQDNDTLLVTIDAGDSRGYFQIDYNHVDPTTNRIAYYLQLTNQVIAIGDGSGTDTEEARAAVTAGKLVLNYEDTNRPSRLFVLRVTARTTGAISSSVSAFVTVTIEDRNDAPEFLSQTRSVSENSEEGTAVGGYLTVSDADAKKLSGITGRSDPMSFKIPDYFYPTFNNYPFTLSSAGLFVVNFSKPNAPTLLDHESQASYVVPVVVSDSGGNNGGAIRKAAANVTLLVSDLNEPPTMNDVSFNLDENVPAGTFVGALDYFDPDDGDEFTFTIVSGDDEGVFGIDLLGNISVAKEGGVDFETTASYNLEVEMVDIAEHNATAFVSITVIDQNDPPTFASSCSVANSLTSNAHFRRYLGYSTVQGLLYSPERADGQSVFVLGTIGEFGTDWEACEERCRSSTNCAAYTHYSSSFPISDWRGTCIGRTAFQSTNTLVQTSADEDNAYVRAGVRVQVCRTVSIDEDVGVGEGLLRIEELMQVRDTEGDAFGLSIVEYGDDLAAPSGEGSEDDLEDGSEVFEVIRVTGPGSFSRVQLNVTDGLSFETTPRYIVEIEAEDDSGAIGTVGVLVEVNNVAEAPRFVEGGATLRWVAELDVGGVEVGDPIECVDDDTVHGDVISYSILDEGNEDGYFEIDNSTAQITLTKDMAATYPHNFSITIVCTDATSRNDTLLLTVPVQNVNSRPEIVNAGVSRSISEDAEIGDTVSPAVRFSDPDVGDTHTWSIIRVSPDPRSGGVGTPLFSINETTGVISLQASYPKVFNYECDRLSPFPSCPTSHRSFTIRVSVRDDGEGLLSAQADVVVTLVDVNEVPEAPTWITLEVNEMEASGASLTWSPGLSGRDEGLLPRIPDFYDDDRSALTFTIVLESGEDAYVGVETVDALDFFAEDPQNPTTSEQNQYPDSQFPSFYLTSLGASTLDYEVFSQFNRTLQISDGTNVVEIGMTVDVIDVQEAPVLSTHSIVLSLEEGIAVGSVIVNMSELAYDPDGDSLRYVVDEVIQTTPSGTNISEVPDASSGLLLENFGMDSSEGVLRVRSGASGQSVVDYEAFVRYVIRLRVSDRASDLDPNALDDSMTVVVNVLDVNDIAIDDVSVVTNGDGTTMTTEGGQILRIEGANLGNSRGTIQPAVRVFYGCVLSTTGETLPLPATSGDDSYTSTCLYEATSCTIATPQGSAIECLSVPGIGKLHAVRVQIGSSIRHTSPLSSVDTSKSTLSYSIPTITDAQMQSSASTMSTLGGEVVVLSGRNFGPITTTIPTAHYVYVTTTTTPTSTRLYPATGCSVTISHTQIQCTTAAGVGHSYWWRVTIGAQQSPSQASYTSLRTAAISAGTASVLYPLPSTSFLSSYTPASVSSLQLRPTIQPSITSLDTIPTTGTTLRIIRVTGSNFGPFLASSTVVTTYASSTTSTSSLVHPFDHVYATLRNGWLVLTAKCQRSLSHTEVVCDVPPGIGDEFEWVLTLGSQASSTAPTNTSFHPPVIQAVSGPGAVASPTLGGARIVVTGSNLGPLASTLSNPSFPTITLSYGSSFQYQAPSCVITRAHEVAECTSTVGTGANHQVQVNVLGQSSNILDDAIHYAPPFISEVIGPASPAAATEGNETAIFVGANLGADASTLDVLSYGIDGSEFVAQDCDIHVPHESFKCKTAPGAGKGLKIFVSVDGLESSSPTSTYNPPTIESTYAVAIREAGFSTRGGEMVVVEGNNFGPVYGNNDAGFLDKVRYGDYVLPASSCQMQTPHTSLNCTTLPGSGQGHPWSVTIHGQTSITTTSSSTTTTSLHYAAPQVLALLQRPYRDADAIGVVVTKYDRLAAMVPTHGATIRVMGMDFGSSADNSSLHAILEVDGEEQSLLEFEEVACESESYAVVLELTKENGAFVDAEGVAGGVVLDASLREDGADPNAGVDDGPSDEAYDVFSAAAGTPLNVTELIPLLPDSAAATIYSTSLRSLRGTAYEPMCWEAELPEGSGRGHAMEVIVGDQRDGRVLAYSYADPSSSALLVLDDPLEDPVSDGEVETRMLVFKGKNFAPSGRVLVAAGNSSASATGEEIYDIWNRLQSRADPASMEDPEGRSIGELELLVFECLTDATESDSSWNTLVSGSGGDRADFMEGRSDRASFTWTHDEVRCLLPPYTRDIPISAGTALLVAGGHERLSEVWNFEDNDPVVESWSPATSRTIGGGTLTISGSYLTNDANQNAIGVLVGDEECEVTSYAELMDDGTLCTNPTGTTCSPRVLQRAEITCTIPPGQGSAALRFTRFGREGESVSFQYRSPVLSAIEGEPAGTEGGWPTQGGVNVTIRGTNLGPNPAVYVNGLPTLTYLTDPETHRTLNFLLPEGRGKFQTVQVFHGLTDPDDQSNTLLFSYGQPLLSPSTSTPAGMRGATVGGTKVLLRGQNFGHIDDGLASVKMGSTVIPTTSWSHEAISFTVPEGQGKDLQLVVTVASQSSDTPVYGPGGVSGGLVDPPIIEFNYFPPTLTSVGPLTSPTSGNYSDGSPVLITVVGTNFGKSKQVYLGDRRLDIVSGAESHEVVVVKVPEGQGEASLRVVAGDQTFADSIPTFVYDSATVDHVVVPDGRGDGCTALEPVSDWATRIARLPEGADTRRLCCGPTKMYIYGSSFGYLPPTVVLGQPNTLLSSQFELVGENRIEKTCTTLETEVRESWATSSTLPSFPSGCFPRDPCIETAGHSTLVLRSVGGQGGQVEVGVEVDHLVDFESVGDIRNYTTPNALSFTPPQISLVLPQPFNPIGSVLEIRGVHLGFDEAIFDADAARQAAARLQSSRRLQARSLATSSSSEAALNSLAAQYITNTPVKPVSTGDSTVDYLVRQELPDTGDPPFGALLPQNKFLKLAYVVLVDGKLCERAKWEREESVEAGARGGTVTIKCYTGRVHVGFVNLTIEIAGQKREYDGEEEEMLWGECEVDWYGQEKEYCLACPTGAICPGALEEPYSEPRFWREEIEPSDPFFKNDDVCHPDRRHRPTCPFFSVCAPDTACVGNNTCATGYTGERCSECIKGKFYRVDGECVKCPENPELLVAAFAIGVLVVIASAYYFNKLNVSIAFVSIGLDYVQVLAIFSRSKVAWPEGLLAFFRILSVFNLNIDITAPDCIVPDLDFRVRWFATIFLPLAVLIVIGCMHLIRVFYERVIKGQKRRSGNSTDVHADALVTTVVTIGYIIYLLLARTCFEVFACNPTVPPDPRGRTYMESTAVVCYEKGGLHLQLLPWAIVILVVYVIGFPVAIYLFLRANRDDVIIDQYMLAKRHEWSPVQDPHMYAFHARYHRLYNFFTPDRYYWILVVFLRKALFAATALVFRANPAFQLAISLLVVFFSFAAQIGFRPFLCYGEYERVIQGMPDHIRLEVEKYEERVRRQEQNAADALWRSRDAAAAGVAREVIARKERRRLESRSLHVNFNTMEAILLACAVLINLSGLLFESDRYADGNARGERDVVTAVVIIIITTSLIYYFTAGTISVLSETRPGYCPKRKGREEERIDEAKRRIRERTGDDDSEDGEELGEDGMKTPLMDNPLHKKKTPPGKKVSGLKKGASSKTSSSKFSWLGSFSGKGKEDEKKVKDSPSFSMENPLTKKDTASKASTASSFTTASGDAKERSDTDAGAGVGGTSEVERDGGLTVNPFLLLRAKKDREKKQNDRVRPLTEEEKFPDMLPEDPPPRWLVLKYREALENLSVEMRQIAFSGGKVGLAPASSPTTTTDSDEDDERKTSPSESTSTSRKKIRKTISSEAAAAAEQDRRAVAALEGLERKLTADRVRMRAAAASASSFRGSTSLSPGFRSPSSGASPRSGASARRLGRSPSSRSFRSKASISRTGSRKGSMRGAAAPLATTSGPLADEFDESIGAIMIDEDESLTKVVEEEEEEEEGKGE